MLGFNSPLLIDTRRKFLYTFLVTVMSVYFNRHEIWTKVTGCNTSR